MKPLIVGQSLARTGDGRPFTGKSGERLQWLVGVDSYEKLVDLFDLTNIFGTIPAKRIGVKGDPFSMRRGRVAGAELKRRILAEGRDHVVMAGAKVCACFGFVGVPLFSCALEKRPDEDFAKFWGFPHPSGINMFWNDHANEQRAQRFLKDLAAGRMGVDSHD